VDDRRKKAILNKGVALMLAGDAGKFRNYLSELKTRSRDHSVIAGLLEVLYFSRISEPVKVMRPARRLLSRTTDPWICNRVYPSLAWALRVTGDLSGAHSVALKNLEMSEETGDRVMALVSLAYNHCFREEFARARELLSSLTDLSGKELLNALHVNVIVELSMGNFVKARELSEEMIRYRESHSDSEELQSLPTGGPLEVLGIAKEALGELNGAWESYLPSLEGYIQMESAYSVFPLNRLLSLRLLSGMDFIIPASLVKKAMRFAKNRAPESQAALTEYRALLSWQNGRFEEAVRDLLEAGEIYTRVNQTLEAFIAFLKGAWLARKSDCAGFWNAMEHLEHRFRVYRDFALNHHFFSNLTGSVIEPILAATSSRESLVKVRLFDRMEVQGAKVPRRWKFKKALTIFKYLLLNQGRSLASDYMVYLLWPRAGPENNMSRLYSCIRFARRELGDLGFLLVCHGKSYALQEDPRLWVDVHEFQSLLKEADALEKNPSLQVEKYMKALELYRGELLPEDRYDRFIEEHRNYLHKRFQKALEKTVNLLLDAGRKGKALELVERFYLMFPDDDACVRIYIGTLVKRGQRTKADQIYREFKRRLWREHRLKPSFDLK